MKYFLPIILVLLFACGDSNQELGSENEESNKRSKSLNFNYNMQDQINDITLINTKTIIADENGEKFSRVDAESNYGFGIQFMSGTVNDVEPFKPSLKFKVRKEDINSDFSIVMSCEYADPNKEPAWKNLKIDSTYVDTPNEWREVNIPEAFELPSDDQDNSIIKIYSLSTDGITVDIDDFSVQW